ncbi:glycosyltransferase family 9 protein [Agarivorans sp.]|uniref:glycosyltransferase family 9 protein n=1 Tax=Agarivorans sp. TaxID=1872412 RepID=UPI003CFFFD84
MSFVKKLRTALRNFDVKRRQRSLALEVGLLKLLSRNKGHQPQLLNPQQVQRVLIVRNNKRIGNMLFLLPFVNSVKTLYPDAKVDLLISEPWLGCIFNNLGLNQVYYSQFGLKTFGHFYRSLASLRRQHYDMLLLPHASSSDRIIASMITSKNVVAFDSPADAAVASHTFVCQNKYPHYALASIELLEQLGFTATQTLNAHIELSADEQQLAKQQLQQLLGENNCKPCLAYFRGARGAKVISDQDWQSLLDKFSRHYGQQINLIEILCPEIAEPLAGVELTYQSRNLREVAAFLQQVPLFLSADTGPLHLASASGAYCVGLFTVTKVAQYGCLGEHVVNLSDLANIDVAKILAELQLDTAISYSEYRVA